MALAAGKLNRRVVIERATSVPDGRGGRTQTWSELRKAWAAATPVAPRESLVNNVQRSSQRWRVEMRFASDLKADDRLRFEGQIIDLEGAPSDPDGRRESIVMFGTGKPG